VVLLVQSIKAFLLCAGKGARWKNATPKHVIPVDNEPILHRTVRMLRERKVSDITIVAHNQNYKVNGCKFVEPKPNSPKLTTNLNIISLWNRKGRTIILHGDTFFSRNAMDRIVNNKKEIAIFGRREKSKYWPKSSWIEVYGVSFDEKGARRYRKALLKACYYMNDKVFADGWIVYSLVIGQFLKQNGNSDYYKKIYCDNVTDEVHEEINDITDDFDFHRRFLLWLENVYKKHKDEA